MRKIPAAIAVLSLAAVGLTGCSLPGASGCSRPGVPDQDVMDLVTVSGDFGAEPTIDVYSPFHTEDISFQDDVTGDGTAIISDAQLIGADVTLFSGETGEIVVSTVDDADSAAVLPISRWIQVFPEIGDALHCATEGSRIVVALPPGGVDPEVAASNGLAEGESAIAVIDLHKVYLSKADGSLVFNAARGLPSVVRAPDGRPGVIIPDGEPPAKLTTQTLIKGDGPVVTDETPVRVHYTGVSWEDRTVFDTTWDSEPASVDLSSEIAPPGFAEALKGQTVGSQVMVVVPADKVGDNAQGSVPSGATLVYVIDILGLDEPAPAP